MRKSLSAFIAFVLFSILSFMLSSCFISDALDKKDRHSSSDLKKRVLMIPIYDQTGKQTELVNNATKQFVSLLSTSPSVMIIEPSEPLPINESDRSPEFGIITSPELISKAKKMGINALITCLLVPIESSTEKTGMWPFRKLSRVFEISMIVNVVDVTTEYLYLTRLDSEKIAFPLEKANEQNEKGDIERALAGAVPKILERQASVIIDMLEESPWIGTITQVTNEIIEINAGRDVGAQPGQIFMVFARSDSIKRKFGRPIDLKGRPVGKIRVTQAMEKHSLAVPVEAGGFVAGQIVSSVD